LRRLAEPRLKEPSGGPSQQRAGPKGGETLYAVANNRLRSCTRSRSSSCST
jgi:hypothetical protein